MKIGDDSDCQCNLSSNKMLQIFPNLQGNSLIQVLYKRNQVTVILSLTITSLDFVVVVVFAKNELYTKAL